MSVRLRSCAAAMVRATCVRDWRRETCAQRGGRADIAKRERSIIYQVKGVLSGRLLPEQGNGLGVI